MPSNQSLAGRRAGLMGLLLVLPPSALAQTDFAIVRNSLQPAAEVRGGNFILHGTAGQPAVGRAEAGELRVIGGFHRSSGAASRIFEDGFEDRSATASTKYDDNPEEPT